MRVAYGVHGYNRGHATRAASILSEITQRHEVMVFAGDDAYDHLAPQFPVERIPSLGFTYDSSGKISPLGTIRASFPKVVDLFQHGPEFRRVMARMKKFKPHVVISDAEAWTHRAAMVLGIPRVGFDHFGVMVYCRVPMPFGDRLQSLLDRLVYKLLLPAPSKVLVSSFYSAPRLSPDVEMVGPLLRDEVHAVKPSQGDHVLVYLNKGRVQWTKRVKSALHGSGAKMHVYGLGERAPDRGLVFKPFGNQSFLEDLASARAVISTAGNQLVGEAMFYGKPLLVMAENTVEQRLNAAAVERMGIGRSTSFRAIDASIIKDFLRVAPQLAQTTSQHARDGRLEALEILERWLEELPSKDSRRLTQAIA